MSLLTEIHAIVDEDGQEKDILLDYVECIDDQWSSDSKYRVLAKDIPKNTKYLIVYQCR